MIPDRPGGRRSPHPPTSPKNQGFALEVLQKSLKTSRPLMRNLSFCICIVFFFFRAGKAGADYFRSAEWAAPPPAHTPPHPPITKTQSPGIALHPKLGPMLSWGLVVSPPMHGVLFLLCKDRYGMLRISYISPQLFMTTYGLRAGPIYIMPHCAPPQQVQLGWAQCK